MHSFLSSASSGKRASRLVLQECARAGTVLLAFVWLMELIIPGSVLASVPFFWGVVAVAALHLVSMPDSKEGETSVSHWFWPIASVVVLIGVIIWLVMRDQGSLVQTTIVLGGLISLVIVRTLAYDER